MKSSKYFLQYNNSFSFETSIRWRKEKHAQYFGPTKKPLRLYFSLCNCNIQSIQPYSIKRVLTWRGPCPVEPLRGWRPLGSRQPRSRYTLPGHWLPSLHPTSRQVYWGRQRGSAPPEGSGCMCTEEKKSEWMNWKPEKIMVFTITPTLIKSNFIFIALSTHKVSSKCFTKQTHRPVFPLPLGRGNNGAPPTEPRLKFKVFFLFYLFYLNDYYLIFY